jgi:porin
MGTQSFSPPSNWLFWTAILVLLLVPHPATAKSLDTIFDDIGNIRSGFKNHGVRLETVNTTDFGTNLNRRGGPKVLILGDIDLLLTLDTEKLMKWEGGTLFLYGQGLYGGSIAEGREAQGVSNISANNTWKLFEAWYQHNLFQERLSLLAGLYEVTSEFDVLRSSSELFIHSSFGTNPTFALSGKNGPSTFPETSLGVRAQVKLTEALTFRAAVADGVPGDPDNPGGTKIKLRSEDGVLVASEAAYYVGKPDPQTKSASGSRGSPSRRLEFRRIGRAAALDYSAKFAIGGWLYTTELEDFSTRQSDGTLKKRDGTFGIYGLAEHSVYGEPGSEDQGLWVFAQLAYADPQVNRFSHYIGGGAVYRGLIPGRDRDETGLAVAVAQTGSHYRRGQRRQGQRVSDQEAAFEGTHAVEVTQGVIVQFDAQYILHPNTDPSRRDAIALITRLELAFNWFE